jgi:hypothetical membrane protein
LVNLLFYVVGFIIYFGVLHMGLTGCSCRIAFYVFLLGLALSLGGVLLAVGLSDWFSWTNNALSDLSHAVRHSDTAVVFNSALMLGGSLFVLGSGLLLCIGECLVFPGFFLPGLGMVLVGGFDEVYGHVHFAVSVFLFASLGLLLVLIAFRLRSPLPIASLVVGAVAWVLHFGADLPRGAAIPEIVTVIAVLPWAFSFFIGLCMNRKASMTDDELYLASSPP